MTALIRVTQSGVEHYHKRIASIESNGKLMDSEAVVLAREHRRLREATKQKSQASPPAHLASDYKKTRTGNTKRSSGTSGAMMPAAADEHNEDPAQTNWIV